MALLFIVIILSHPVLPKFWILHAQLGLFLLVQMTGLLLIELKQSKARIFLPSRLFIALF